MSRWIGIAIMAGVVLLAGTNLTVRADGGGGGTGPTFSRSMPGETACPDLVAGSATVDVYKAGSRSSDQGR